MSQILFSLCLEISHFLFIAFVDVLEVFLLVIELLCDVLSFLLEQSKFLLIVDFDVVEF
jgi:hypothetical protein